MGRIRLGRLPDASGLSLRRFIEANVEPGTVVVTDAWGGYPVVFELLAADGLHYTHKAINLSATTDAAHIDFPHVHRVAALGALAARNPPRLRRGGPPRRLPRRLLRMGASSGSTGGRRGSRGLLF